MKEKTLKVKCEVCGHTFLDNPTKHKDRDKYCPNPRCRAVYKKGGFFHFNLDWVKKKVNLREQVLIMRQNRVRQQSFKSLRMQLGRDPTETELNREWMNRLTMKQGQKVKRGRPQ